MTAINRAIEILGSQTALAKKAGVSQAAISKIASGKTSISPVTALLVEAATSGDVSRHDLCPHIFGDAA